MMTTVNLILTIVTVFSSYLVFRAFYKFHSLRTVSNIILVSLSVADSLLAVIFILNIIGSYCLPHGRMIICKLISYFSCLITSVIILHLALISVERFIAVKFALRYRTIVTHRRALFASIAVWLWVVVVTIVLPHAVRLSSNDTFQSLVEAIHPCSKTREGPLDHDLSPFIGGYLIFFAVSLLIIPLMIILCSYSYIFIVSRQHRQQIREQEDIPGMPTIKQEMKGARTLAIVVAVCLLSIVPLLIVACLRFFGKLPECHHPKRRYIIFIAYNVATGLNAICNPLVYGWRNEEFRSAFRKLLKCA